MTEQLEVTKRLASFVALKRDRSGLQRWNAQIIPGARGVRHAGLKTRAPSINLGDKHILNLQGEDGEPYRSSSRIRKLLVLIGTGVLTLGARVFRPAWFPVRVLVVSRTAHLSKKCCNLEICCGVRSTAINPAEIINLLSNCRGICTIMPPW